MSLADELRSAGLTVKEYSGWSTRGGSWAQGNAPVGIMEHHTAPPVPYPIDQLAGSDQGRIKCNINTKPDGTIWLVAYEACNYSSGSGVGKVLSEVKAGTPPDENAVDRGWDSGDDDTNGNPYFWNFENDHEGDGSGMPAVQFNAIITASRVVAKHFGLSEKNTISHAEWTARKGDPYWDQSRRCIEQIRSGMATSQEDELSFLPITPESDSEIIRLLQDRLYEAGDSSVKTNGTYDTATKNGVKEYLHFTGADDAATLAGERVNANIWDGITKTWILAFIPSSSGGGMTQAQADERYTKKGASITMSGKTP